MNEILTYIGLEEKYKVNSRLKMASKVLKGELEEFDAAVFLERYCSPQLLLVAAIERLTDMIDTLCVRLEER